VAAEALGGAHVAARQRHAGEKIVNRLVSLFDPDARPIRKGKKANPNQFGSMVQYTELTANTRRGARGLLVPPKVAVGNVHENALLPETVAEIIALDLRPPEAVFDRGFTTPGELDDALPPIALDARAASPTSSASTAPGALD